MTNEEFEPIRIRIMKEAYDLADRNDTEGYNAIKVMCSDVQSLMQSTDVKYDGDTLSCETIITHMTNGSLEIKSRFISGGGE